MIQKSIIRLPEYNSQLLRYVNREICVFIKLIFAFSFLITLFVSTGCGGLVSHKVEPGESLYSIGFYYGHDYRDIAKWNNISPPYVIRKGQWLRLTPPDEKWWEDEQRRRNTQNAKTAKSKQYQGDGQNKRYSVRKDNGTTSHASRSTNSSRVANAVSKKQVVVPDFTDKAGKINQWVWPTRGRLLGGDKKFSQRNKGIDIVGKRGQLVYAAAAGKIVYSGSGLIGYGKLIIVKHNKIYLSAYAHNDQILVKEGDIVKRGEKIARMGRTPDNNTQLHFEIRKYGKPVDPLRYLSH